MDIGRVAYSTIPPATGESSLKYAKGYTADIMKEVFDCYREKRDQLKDFAPYLQKGTIYETCRAIWQFVKSNIRYKVDPIGQQWVKTPARLFEDKVGDCKSFSVFIASCLYNLGINGMFRFVSFNNSPLPTHVYVIVPYKGRMIKIDAVLPWFDKEKPYRYKHDYNMTEISRLSGIGEQDSTEYYGAPVIDRVFSVMGEQPAISGFFDGLFGVNKKMRDTWRANLPVTCGAFLYVFIPDDQVADMPPAVQAKRQKQIDAIKFMDDKADKKYSYQQAVDDIHNAVRNTYHMEPVDLINATFGTHIGFIVAAATALVSLALNMKNIIGHYGQYGFDFPKDLDPGAIAPTQEDWVGWSGMDTTDAQTTATSANSELVSTGSKTSSMNPLLMLGLLGAGAYMLFKK